MGKCMSKDQMQDAVIQHISSPVRTDDGVGFALGRLSSSQQTRWLKYEDLIASEEEKPVVSEGQVIMSRSGSRSYALPLPQGHLVSCAAFVNGGSRRDSKECTCGHRRPSDAARILPSTNSPAQRQPLQIIQKLSPVVKATSEPKRTRNGPENDVENVGAKPVKLTFNTSKTRPALRDMNVNVNVLADILGPKSGKPGEPRDNVDVEDMLPRRVSPRRPLRPSLTEKEFQALDSPRTEKTPTKQHSAAHELTVETVQSPVKAEKFPAPVSSPRNMSTNSLGSSLQSILSAISDPESTSLMEEVLSKASAAQSKCTDLERGDSAESKASHSPLNDDSDSESSSLATDADTPCYKALSSDSVDQFEDDVPGNTPISARSVRIRLPVESEFRKEDKPLHWKASALYTNCLFEESPAKNPVKSAERQSSVGITKFTFGPEAEVDPEHRSEKPRTTAGSDSAQEALPPDNADVGVELKRKSVDEALSLRASFKKVKSLTENDLPSDLHLPTPGSSYSDHELNTSKEEVGVTPVKDAVTPENEIAPDVKAFLETSKKVVLSLTSDSTTECETGTKKPPSLTDPQATCGFKEIFSSNSLAAVLELETLMVTSDVRRMSGHGVEGLQIVGSELTELFSSSGRFSSVEGNKVEAASAALGATMNTKTEVNLGNLTVNTNLSLPTSESSPAVSSTRSLASVVPSPGEGAKMAPTECREESTDRVSPAQGPEGALKPVRRKADVTSGSNSSGPTTTLETRLSLSCSHQPVRDPSSKPEASALSLEEFQLLLDAAEREEDRKVAAGGSAGTCSGNTLTNFGRSILQILLDSLPTTPNSSLPSTPRLSACSTPVISKGSTPKRTSSHAKSVSLSPEEIAEIWGAFEQSHLM